MKKHLLTSVLFSFFLIFFSTVLFGQDNWSQKSFFGGFSRYYSAGFSIGNKGYIGTGFDGTVGYDDFWEYDKNGNFWTQKADLPGLDSARYNAAAFSIGNKGYLGTGYNQSTGNSLNDFFEYDPAGNTWTPRANFPGGKRRYATGISIGNRGYIGMGDSVGVYKKDWWEYDPGTDNWMQKASFPGSVRVLAAGFANMNKGYVGTGFDGVSMLNDFYEYDKGTNSWVVKASFAGTARYGAVGLFIAGKGYIGTGYNGSFLSDFWEYDIAGDLWVARSSFSGIRYGATGFTIGGRGYIGTGYDGTGYYNDFWEYRPLFQYSFTSNPDSGCSPMNVQFTSTSTDPDITSVNWFFGNGNQCSTCVASVAHTYSWSGTFSPNANFYDAGGSYLGGYSGAPIFVQTGSTGTFYMSKDSICPGEQVYFDAQGNPSPFTWKFSDGYTTTNYSFTRTLNTLGTYTVNLIVPTPCGNDTITKLLKVTNTIPPNPNFYINNTPSCPNKQIYFSPNQYEGSHSWNFGDASSSTLQSPYHSYSALGTYTVTHTLTNACNNSASQSYVVNIVDTINPTNANFNYYPSTPLCPGIQISFNSNNYEGQWTWSFGDGDSATSQNPKHTYTAPGNYSVTLTITNTCNNSTSSSQTLSISGTLPPNPNFSFNPNPACPNDLIYFSPQEQYGKTFFWNFGDGNTSSLKYPSHKYTSLGTYAITYTVTNFCNLTATKSDSIKITDTIGVNLQSWQNLYVNPQTACPSQPCSLSVGAYGYAMYVFNYGDGVIDTLTYPDASHSYTAAGTYNASVKIINNCGNFAMRYDTVTISATIPFPGGMSLNSNPASVCPGENANFNAPWGYPSYQWNMGDGSPAFTSQNSYLSYSYSTTGTYIVSVLVTNYCGGDTTVKDTITVNNSPYFTCASCSSVYVSSATPACPNQNVNFNASSGYAWYTWYFGDGDSTSSSSYQATHSYSASGTYNYTVTITNFCGIDTTLYNSLSIDTTLQVPGWLWMGIYPDIVCPGQEVQFNTDNYYSSYFWNFGDGSSGYGSASTSHTYTASGTYNATVTVGNACGNTNSVQGTVVVDTAATFPNWIGINQNPSPSCPNSGVTLETTAGYVSYFWDFGDGDTVTTSTAKVTHVYASAGTYQASVFITNSCGNTVTLYQNISITNNVNISWLDIYLPNNPACPGDVVMMNINPNNTNWTFSWDYGDGSALDTTIGTGTSHTYTATGVYNVVVTGTNACGNSKTASKLVTINNSASPQLSPWTFGILAETTQTVNAVCPGDVLVFYFEGVNPNNLWNFGDGNTGVATDIFVRSDGVTVTTIKHAYITVGTYNYSLTLGNNCGNSTSLSKSINVSTGMLMSGGFMISPPSSILGYTTCGVIDFVAYGGNNFDWDFGDGNTLSTLSPTVGHSYTNSGNYTVKVTITNGCGNSGTYVKTLIVNGVGGTSVSSSSIVSPTCYGGNDGSASSIVSGGQVPYNYIWTDALGNTISTNASASGLSAGTYNLTVTDNSGCAGYASVTLNNPTAITITTSSTQSSCGGSTGTASVSGISGGTSPFTYAWSNGQTTSTATGLSLGSYPVTITDVNGCTASGLVSVSENGATLSVSSTTSVTCNGGTNGAVTINATGGTPPYTFAWSNGATTQNIASVAAGNYSVVVTDSAGCQATINGIVNEPAVIAVNPTTAQAPTCGNFNGSSTANVTGGNSPYTYLWDANAANQTTQTATGLPAGTYSVTVTDASSCTKVGVITLSNANAPVVTSVITAVSCNGMTDGAVDLTVTGGTSPYLYTWNVAPPNQQDQTNLGPGTYIVTIQDAAGCVTLKSYTFVNPAVLAASLSSTAATCSSNGTAASNVSGGTSPYTYSWTGGATTSSVTGLVAGNYTLTVTDSHSCTATSTVSVSSDPMNASVSSVPVNCFGQSNGSAGVTVSGGSGNYTYSWSNSATTQNISGVVAANYTVMVTDASGCMQTLTVAVTEPAVLLGNLSQVDVTCNGLCNGTATANPTGGNSPYLYSWSSGSTTSTASGLCPNVYNVTITDSKGCNVTPNVTITEPTTLTASVSSSQTTCGVFGSATATPSGGTSPYTYNWSNATSMQTATGLAAGNYSVAITDANGCVTSGSVAVSDTTLGVDICIVTVDSTSTMNRIVWGKPVGTPIDSIRIYRDIASVYTWIGSVSMDSLSMFDDVTNGVNPNLTSYRYKISGVDSCGNESGLSSFHKTIHLQVSPALPTGYNLNWDDYLGFTVAQYRILRDTNNLGNFVPIDSVPFGITAYTDPIQWDSAGYLIEIDHPTGCNISIKNPNTMASNLNSSRSNIYRTTDSTLVSVNETMNAEDIAIMPNPNFGYFSIATGKLKIRKIEIIDMLGRDVFSMNTISPGNRGKYTINLPRAQGVYTLKLISDSGIIIKKFIIE